MLLRRERGSVTAELVVALPAVIVVLAACLGGVRVGMQAMLAQDAAAVAARSAARGDGGGGRRRARWRGRGGSDRDVQPTRRPGLRQHRVAGRCVRRADLRLGVRLRA
jgi:hypothetical protein